MRLEGIDNLRGLAVSLVILYHFFELLGLHHHNFYTYISSIGQLGVPLFFIISGFLIYRSVDYSISAKGMKAGIKNYFSHRLFRILPAYYVNFIAVFILAFYFMGTMETWSSAFIQKQIYSHLTFTSYFLYQTSGLGINGAYWTLSIEMLWYIVAPLFFIFIKKDRYYVVLMLLGFLYFWSIDLGLMDYIFNLQKDAPNYMAKLFFFSFQLPGQIIYFIAGIFIYKYHVKETLISKYMLYTLFIILVSTFLYVSMQNYFLKSFTVRNAFVLFTVASLFMLFYRVKMNELFLLSWLGKISYSLYLWHMPILFMLKKYFMPYEPSWWSISILFTILLLSISSLSYYFVEESGFRLRRMLDRKLKKPHINTEVIKK